MATPNTKSVHPLVSERDTLRAQATQLQERIEVHLDNMSSELKDAVRLIFRDLVGEQYREAIQSNASIYPMSPGSPALDDKIAILGIEFPPPEQQNPQFAEALAGIGDKYIGDNIKLSNSSVVHNPNICFTVIGDVKELLGLLLDAHQQSNI